MARTMVKRPLTEDNIGGTTYSVAGTHNDTDVGTGQDGGVVGTVTSHSAKTAKTLKRSTQVSVAKSEQRRNRNSEKVHTWSARGTHRRNHRCP